MSFGFWVLGFEFRGFLEAQGFEFRGFLEAKGLIAPDPSENSNFEFQNPNATDPQTLPGFEFERLPGTPRI